jgi:serine/threonine-protein kinase
VDRLRVTVTLTTAADGIQVWSERYDRKMDDVFEIQDDITGRVAAALRGHLTSELPRASRGTRNIEAYRAYLRGRHLWNRRTERALRQSIAHMQEAIGLDPSYAGAHAGLADSLVTLGIYGVSSPAEVMPAALDAARRALELDPALAEALVVRGAVRALRDWDWGAAEHDFRQAIELDPHYATGHHWYANHVLMPQGRFDEAARALTSALELDPGAPTVAISRGFLFALRGETARAIEQLQELLDRDPELAVAHYFLGQVYDRQSRFDEARAAFNQALAVGGESAEVLATLAYTEARAGRTTEAQSGYARLVGLGASRYVSPALLALVRLGLGDLDGAIGFLEEAVAVKATELVWLKVRWCYDPLRELPRFQAVVGRVGGWAGRRIGG